MQTLGRERTLRHAFTWDRRNTQSSIRALTRSTIRLGVELRFEEFKRLIVTKLAGGLPGPGYWSLCLPSNIGQRIERRNFAAAQKALIEWLPTAAAQVLSNVRQANRLSGQEIRPV